MALSFHLIQFCDDHTVIHHHHNVFLIISEYGRVLHAVQVILDELDEVYTRCV